MVDIAVMAIILGVIGIAVVIGDTVMPHIPAVQKFLDSLPVWDDEED